MLINPEFVIFALLRFVLMIFVKILLGLVRFVNKTFVELRVLVIVELVIISLEHFNVDVEILVEIRLLVEINVAKIFEDDKLVEIILPVDMLEIFKEPIDILFIKAFPIVAFKMLPLLIYAFALVEDISIVFCSVLFVSVLFAVTFKLPVSL